MTLEMIINDTNARSRSRLVSCETFSLPIRPLDLRIVEDERRGVLYRIFRGIVRAGWILLKLSPCLILSPLAVFSEGARVYWWKYALWALATSGPTAIKFAQWVGTRPDLFPRSAVEALAKFHTNSVSMYTLEQTTADLDSIYGPSWREWLELVDDARLIGSGAIAHVSRGRLISGPGAGTHVALKIAHRGVREIIEADLDIMAFGGWMLSKLPALTSLDVPGAVEEFGKFMRSQTNLLTEADNINRFSILFRDRPDIRFPKVFIEHCTKDILVETFEEGIPLGRIIEHGSTKLKKKVCDLGVDAFLKMLFVDNFVHGDLHPGNIFFRPASGETDLDKLNKSGDVAGRVIFIDCGLIAQLGRRDERNFIDLMHAVITGKSREVGKLMIERSRSPPDTVHKPHEFCDKVARLVDSTVTGKSLIFGGLEFGAVITQLLNIARQHKVRLETDFVSVAFALIVLEGVGKQLDPRRNLLWEAEPYILRQFLRRAKEYVTGP
jgi:aarF domain-containing kinase